MDPSPAGGAPEAGSELSIVSGETGSAVVPASVALDGRALALDGAGRVTLPEGAGPGATLDVRAAGYLERTTRLRSLEPVALWPRQSPTGLDEAFTRALVYDASIGDTLAGGALYRPGEAVREIYVAPSPGLRDDAATMGALHEGSARLSAATGGGLRFVVAAAPPAGALRFDARFDPGAAACAGRRLAYLERVLRGFEIVGGALVFCRFEGSRTQIVMHELGHGFGLRHSPDPRDLMFADANAALEPSPREQLLMRLMLQRRPGNRYPDRDPDVASSGAPRRETLVCR